MCKSLLVFVAQLCMCAQNNYEIQMVLTDNKTNIWTPGQVTAEYAQDPKATG